MNEVAIAQRLQAALDEGGIVSAVRPESSSVIRVGLGPEEAERLIDLLSGVRERDALASAQEDG